MEKLNIAELLKNCPTGMELDCMMFEGLEFDGIVDNEYLPIRCRIKNPCGGYNVYNFTKYGCWLDTTFAKCIIFPKGKTTWEGFQRPFKDGDIVFYYDTIAIFKEWGDETLFRTYVTKYLCCDFIDTNVPLFGKSVRKEIRFANEEEKQSLFDAIKANGYRWNAETKTLEKLIEPKFKVGDRIRNVQVDLGNIYTIIEVGESSYVVNKNNENNNYDIDFMLQDDWELAPNKFDITTLKPFESKVLVRHHQTSIWMPAIFGGYDIPNLYYYAVGGTWWKYCIPYKGNEYLRGTADDCNNYYKTWE